jgi:thioredoxin reductase (NADPH)
VIGQDKSVLLKADRIENYFGFAEPVSGKYLLEQGEKQASKLGVKFENSEVIALEKGEFFEVYTTGENYSSKALLLATGQQIARVRIERIADFEGNGISYCTTCDGFFYRGLKVGLLGYKDFAIHEAMELEPLSKDITIYTNGKELELSDKYKNIAAGFKINKDVIKSVDGNDALECLVFEDGTREKLDGLFIAYDSASSVDFARKLGVITNKNAIVVDDKQKTNMSGLFAAGDCTGGLKQISTAVGQGALAARQIIEYVRNLNK